MSSPALESGLTKRRVSLVEYMNAIESTPPDDVPRTTPRDFPPQRAAGDRIEMPLGNALLVEDMPAFEVLSVLGSGSYGDALLAAVRGGTANGDRVVMKEFRSDRTKPEGRRRHLYASQIAFRAFVRREYDISISVTERAPTHQYLSRYVALARAIFALHVSRELEIIYIVFTYLERSSTLDEFLITRLYPLWRVLERRDEKQYRALALRLSVSLLEAVAALHTLGVLHRDLKLDNVLVVDDDDAPRVVLIDLGMACVLPDPLLRSSDDDEQNACQWPYVTSTPFEDPQASLMPKPATLRATMRALQCLELYSVALIIYELFASDARVASMGETLEMVRGLVTLLNCMRDMRVADRPTAAECLAHMQRLERLHDAKKYADSSRKKKKKKPSSELVV